MSNGMPEQYVVIVDGRAEGADFVGRGRALGLALSAVDSMRCVDVAVADARTLRVCARWHRNGLSWDVKAVAGWLS
jgi:hypothetical protein